MTQAKTRSPAEVWEVLYRSPRVAFVTDLRDPYNPEQIHPEWRRQFIAAINSPKVHEILERTLSRFAPFILGYTKVAGHEYKLADLCKFERPTIVLISGVGDDPVTPWMVLHHIGHVIISQHLEVKREMIAIIDQTMEGFGIYSTQDQLVECSAAKERRIPNLNELMYELFTTWLWHGHTTSPHRALAAYCDQKFARLLAEHGGQTIIHSYRSPVEVASMPWLVELFS